MPKMESIAGVSRTSKADILKTLQKLANVLYWEWNAERRTFRFEAAESIKIWKPELLPDGKLDVALVALPDQARLNMTFETIFKRSIPSPISFEARPDHTASVATYMLRFEPDPDEDRTIIRGIIEDVSNKTILSERARSAEQKLLHALDVLPDGFVVYDSDDRLVACNRRYRELYPKSAHAMITGAKFSEILRAGLKAGEYAQAIGREEEWFEERMAKHEATDTKIESLLGDGRWLRIAERQTEDGMRVGLRSDITRLKQNEADLKATLKRLQQSELEARRLSVVADRTRSMVLMLDKDGRVEWVNPAFTEITGYLLEEIVGKDPRPILRGADTDKSLIDTIDKAIAQGKSVSGKMLQYKKNGEPFWVEFERQTIKDKDKDGAVIQHMIVSHDVTEDVAAAEALAERAESIRAILDTVVDGIITIDNNGIILTFNPAAERMFGMRRQDAIGESFNTLIAGHHHTNHPQYITSYLSSRMKSGKERELTAVKADGTVFPIEIAIGEMFVGKNIHFVGIVRDISERKQLDRIKREFISTVSHELKTPLTSITGALGLASGGALGSLSEQMRQIIDIAYRNSERLGVLITDILDFEKIDAGEISYDMRESNIDQLIADCVISLQPYANKFGITVNIVGKADNPVFIGDPNRISQVITNLISNGVKFSKSGQHVDVKSENTSDCLTFSVTDHGKGIPEELHKRIFTHFFRADNSDDRNTSGTGLGLSISKPIVEAHRGVISVESQVGAGSTFTVTLPSKVNARNN